MRNKMRDGRLAAGAGDADRGDACELGEEVRAHAHGDLVCLRFLNIGRVERHARRLDNEVAILKVF